MLHVISKDSLPDDGPPRRGRAATDAAHDVGGLPSREQILGALAAIVGERETLPGDSPSARYALSDATAPRGIVGTADAVVTPASAGEVAAVMAWCYERGVALVARGGGTGLAGGAVPQGGVVVDLRRMDRLLAIEPELWRMHVQAGMTTANVQRLARESGLLFPPDPGAAESSTIGGNIATNAGGPHAFKYGVTGRWVTGIEVVVPPGRVVRLGGTLRKDAAGYDLAALLVGSEGTLGIVTAAWLRLVPAPEVTIPVVAGYPSARAGCAAVAAVMGSGIQAAALDYLDAGALSAAAAGFPGGLPDGTGFALVAEADGDATEAEAVARELEEALGEHATFVRRMGDRAAVRNLWAWRDGVAIAVAARRGAKASEDVVVPLERLGEAVEQTVEIGRRHGLEACSWGHAGDGNLHATFLVDPHDPAELERAAHAEQELFAMAVELGGSVSGEHGLGSLKSGTLARYWDAEALALHDGLKRLFDPRGLMNPGKKLAVSASAPPD